ncbi:MAG TPA: hypothetical protein VG294_16425 [Solirubrobacteraceae bacterium]|nr:hypothetical protein [Solirubrobacteraceae bacterium]
MATAPTQALFQVAVVLIPALLLGGGLVRPAATTEAAHWYSKTVALMMVVLVMSAVGGELVAINGAFAVSPSEASIRIVVGVLLAGTVVIGLRTARHWVDRVISRAAKKYVYTLAVVVAVVSFVGGQVIVTNTIHEAQAAQALTAVQSARAAAQSAHGAGARAAGRAALAAAERTYRAACRQAPGFAACSAAVVP